MSREADGNDEVGDNIRSGYHGDKPYSFSSKRQVYKNYPHLPRSTIDKALLKSDTYTRFKPYRKPKHFSPIYVSQLRELWQADLAFFRHPNIKAANDPFQYLLVIIDCWSRAIWLEPLKSKECREVAQKFRKILNSTTHPKRIQSDQGGEFKCDELNRFFDRKNIFQYFSYSSRKSAFAERVILSVKSILYKLMDFHKTNKWVELIPQVLKIYMNRRHSSIKMTPNQAELEESQAELFRIHQIKYGKVKKREKPKFKVGDTVRVAIEYNREMRGWKQKWSDDIYIVRSILTNLPVVRYVLTDPLDGEPMRGNWFQDEISLVSV